MEPCISEYGLIVVQGQDQSFLSQSDSFKTDALGRNVAYSTFKLDVYGFGVVLLELLTGKLVQNNGFDLASWVHSVVREEWTAEVFDRALISEGAGEERMLNLLQVALKCINPSPNERPSTSQISAMINTIKEDEERYIISDP
jgi:serine/threonine protein kinase